MRFLFSLHTERCAAGGCTRAVGVQPMTQALQEPWMPGPTHRNEGIAAESQAAAKQLAWQPGRWGVDGGDAGSVLFCHEECRWQRAPCGRFGHADRPCQRLLPLPESHDPSHQRQHVFRFDPRQGSLEGELACRLGIPFGCFNSSAGPCGMRALQAIGLQSARTTPVGIDLACAACRVGWTKLQINQPLTQRRTGETHYRGQIGARPFPGCRLRRWRRCRALDGSRCRVRRPAAG